MKLTLVIFGLLLRDAHADERTYERGNSCPAGRVRQDHSQRPGRDCRTDHRDHARNHTEPDQATYAGACHRTCERSFTSICILPILALHVTTRNADLVLAEPGPAQLLDRPV